MQDDSFGSSPSKCNRALKKSFPRELLHQPKPFAGSTIISFFSPGQHSCAMKHHFFAVHCVHFIYFFPLLSWTASTPHPSRLLLHVRSVTATVCICVLEIFCVQHGQLLKSYYPFSNIPHCYRVTIIDHVSLWETFPILIVITIITTIQNHDHGVESTPY
ncbi:hypothetical protein HOY82DRAFT_67027 [Tuber indicum]|nr:hypothetical protein HOY82DRAFT_67027 [Tuber indicum]